MHNQEAKADRGKLQLTLVPRQIIREIAKVRMYGTKKYKDPDNWKRVEVERYRDAAFRHFLAYLDDPYSIDEESGLPHLSHLACNIAFLCELQSLKITITPNSLQVGNIIFKTDDELIVSDEALFKRLSELEEAYVAGHITMANYVNEYNKLVNEKREKEKQHEKETNDTSNDVNDSDADKSSCVW